MCERLRWRINSTRAFSGRPHSPFASLKDPAPCRGRRTSHGPAWTDGSTIPTVVRVSQGKVVGLPERSEAWAVPRVPAQQREGGWRGGLGGPGPWRTVLISLTVPVCSRFHFSVWPFSLEGRARFPLRSWSWELDSRKEEPQAFPGRRETVPCCWPHHMYHLTFKMPCFGSS